MTTTTDSEIDVQQLMTEIRAAVAKREVSGNRSIIGASLELRKLLATTREFSAQESKTLLPGSLPEKYAALPPLKLQPDFVNVTDDHYHVDDLLRNHDHIFVWNAYRALLKREPDEHGLREFLTSLRSGRFNKIDVLARLRYSPEGKSRNVRVDGLRLRSLIRKLYRVPVLGYMLEMAFGIVRLPATARTQRQLEAHVLAQLQLLADQVNLLSQTGFEVAESYSRELSQVLDQQGELAESTAAQCTEVAEGQRKFAELQHQQIAGIFREQREVLEGLRRFREELGVRLNSLEVSSHGPASTQTPPARIPPGLEELLDSFNKEFRGTAGEIKEGLKFYLPLLKTQAIETDILDLGSGRGEWLELLSEEGLRARGVESNRVTAAEIRRKGLEVIEQDALDYLRSLPDTTLSAVTGFHFIEHVSFVALIELLDEIMRTLKPGGLVIFETPNPKNLVVGACNFYSDPTHHKPLFPETLSFILRNRGFTDVKLEYVNPVGDSPFADEGQSSRVLDSWFYSPRDFAVIARKN